MKKFIDKYTPKSLDQVVSNKKAVLQIKQWAQNYKQKPLFIYGQTGVGKTLCANLIAKEMGWSVLDTDATDVRSKENIRNIIAVATTSNTLFSNTRLILMDEVDAISDKRGGEDSGFFSEFSKVISKSVQPIIFIANDPYENKKVRPLFEKCEKVKFDLPNKLSIKKFAKEICEKENIEYDLVSMDALIENINNDIRAMLIDLYTLSLNKKITLEDVEGLGERRREEDVFKALQKIFFPKDFYETRYIIGKTNINWDLLFAWLEENIPRQYKHPINLSQGLEKLSKADILKGRIRAQNWTLLKYIFDYLTIGVAYSKTEKEKVGFNPFQFPKFLRSLSASKKERTIRKEIINKIQQKAHCSKHIIMRDHLPILQIIAKTNKFTEDIVKYFDLTLEEIKLLGAKITPKQYEKLI